MQDLPGHTGERRSIGRIFRGRRSARRLDEYSQIPMFQLTLLDHLRLTFGHVVYRHKAHAHTAQTRAQRNRWIRSAEALLIAGAAFTSVAASFGKGIAFSIAAAVLAALALLTLLLDLSLDLDASAR